VTTTDKNMPESRAAVKRENHQYVHAVLLNDPVVRQNRQSLRHIKFRHEPEYFDSWNAPEAICGRTVRVVYPLTFKPDDEGDACPDCARLISIFQLDPERYKAIARQFAEQVRERESRARERHEKAREKQAEAERKLARMFADADDEEEVSPELRALLEPRAERNDSDASDTA
jgi:hypothetical protein